VETFQNFGEDKRGRSETAKIHNFSHTEPQIALPFIFHISAICSYSHRDTEVVPDTFVSGKKVLQQLRTDGYYRKLNNNTSSRYRGLPRISQY
jgi:hypothetical protein